MRFFYQTEQRLPLPLDQVFAFFANPENLPRLMPSWQKARIEEATFVPPPPCPQPEPANSEAVRPAAGFKSIAAGAGTRMTLSFLPFPHSPIRIPWEAEITEFAWNDHFCDTQLRGPFAYWRHCHSVSTYTHMDKASAAPCETLLRDTVEYELPLGRLGELAHHLLVSKQLQRTFAYRQARTLELLAPVPLQARS